jgi:hypothetical protein
MILDVRFWIIRFWIFDFGFWIEDPLPATSASITRQAQTFGYWFIYASTQDESSHPHGAVAFWWAYP